MFSNKHVLWMAYLEGGSTLLEDMPCRNTGFTGGIALKGGMPCKMVCFTGGPILLKGIIGNSMHCTGTQV